MSLFIAFSTSLQALSLGPVVGILALLLVTLVVPDALPLVPSGAVLFGLGLLGRRALIGSHELDDSRVPNTDRRGYPVGISTTGSLLGGASPPSAMAMRPDGMNTATVMTTMVAIPAQISKV